MISVSDDFKQAMKAPVKTIRATIAVDGGTSFVSSDQLISFSTEADGYYFGSTTKSLSFKVLGTEYSLLNTEISVVLEVCTSASDDIWESCDLGKFKIVEQSTNLESETTEFKAYDTVGMMGRHEYDGNLSFPCTVANLVSQIASRYSLVYSPVTLVNGNYSISEDLYSTISNLTYRDILSEIAGATATIARIDGISDTLTLGSLPTTSLETLTYSNLRKVSLEPIYGPVNSVVLARTPAEDNIVAKDDESIEEFGLTELKLANNEILDDDRESLISSILDAVDGFSFYPFEATTEGHGWYQCGDRITISNGTDTFDVIITHIRLTIDGGMKEVIKGIRPEESDTNYALAGGITKTIYNTEIKVDKQGQTIQSVVEEQSVLENRVNDNYTEITQSISSVITSVQNSGGNNLIKNSAMYSLDDDRKPLSWELGDEGTIAIAPSAEAAVNGSLSRQNISLCGMEVSQTIEVKADSSSVVEKTYYSFSCKIKKTAVGSCYVRITDGTESGIWSIELENGETSFYKDFCIEAMLPNSSNLVISVYGSSDSEFSITDMMLAVGDYKSQWTQANGEFANTQVTIDSNGVIIRSNTLDGVYTKQTPQEISTYANNSLTATINDDGVSAPKVVARNEISMSPIKIVPQSDGWAFVSTLS